MMKSLLIIFLLGFTLLSAQQATSPNQLAIEGKVRTYENKLPIGGVNISSSGGAQTISNGLGEFKIKARVGEVLYFEGQGIEPIQYTILNDEEVILEVRDYEPSNLELKRTNWAVRHQQLLDSAQFYKKKNLEKSIGFVSESMQGAKEMTKLQLSRSLTTLGEIYIINKQYDLAATNLEDAIAAKKTVKAELLYAQVLLELKDFQEAENTLVPLLKQKGLPVEQQLDLQEYLGMVYLELKEYDRSIDYFKKAELISEKGNMPSRTIGILSQIGQAYAAQDKQIEAKTYFEKAMNLSKSQSPQEAIQESEKVADFYNQSNKYEEEIGLRKKNLRDLNRLPKRSIPNLSSTTLDTISPQVINYKIGRAYVSNNELDKAIPYLQKSIVEADKDADLEIQKVATRKLSEVYESQGDFTKAYKTYRDYVALVDSLYVKKEQEISLLTRLNREIVKNKNRILSLEQDRALSQNKYAVAVNQQNLMTQKSERQKWLIYSLILVLTLLAITAFFYYQSNGKQKLANNQLALKSLRTQMNPHFIFNALNSVNHYIAKNDERSANRFLSEFSMLMRNVLENSEQEYIPLSKELELLRLYLKLEHARFPDQFDYTIDVKDNVQIDHFNIPPMMLQPYVENAVWHGLRYKELKGMLEITLEQKDNQLTITIMDDGVGRKKSAELKTQHQLMQKSKGMGNIAKRIQILNEIHKDKIAVEVSDLNSDGTGTIVVLTLKSMT